MNETKKEIVSALAKKHKQTFTVIKAVIDSQDKGIADTIRNDDVYLNIKLDYLGKFETLPYRRKMVEEARERNRLKRLNEGTDEAIRGSRVEGYADRGNEANSGVQKAME